MNLKDKIQLSLIINCPPEHQAEGDKIFASHEKWIAATHDREGDKALLHYTVAKGKDDSGNFVYILVGIFETEAGVNDHMMRDDFELTEDFRNWVAKCDVTGPPPSVVVNSLW